MGTRFLMSKRTGCGLLLVLLLCLAGCSGNRSLQTKVIAGAGTKMCSIAILPFENWARSQEVALLGERIFTSQLIQTSRFNIVQTGDVGMFFLRQRLRPGTSLFKSQLSAMANQLGADVVIQGRIVDAGSVRQYGGGKVPFLSLAFNIYEANTGRLILNTVYQNQGDDYRKIMHFGVETTMSGLAGRMSQEIIEDWFSKGIACQ